MKFFMTMLKLSASKIIMLTFFTCAFIWCQLQCQAQPTLFGMTSTGGNQFGSIFGIPTGGTSLSSQYNFEGILGQNPQYSNLIQALNGKLYGMTGAGGANDDGVLFEYDAATDVYTRKFDFSSSSGENPLGSLIQASNGKLYGMTSGGGANNSGVLFEYDLGTNVYTKKFEFSYANGGSPFGSLTQASNGKLYGMTSQGGADYVGVLFEYDPGTNVYTKKFEFSGADGGIPYGSLLEAANGKLYGMTGFGGASGDGVLFEYDPGTDVYTKKFDFSSASGENPLGSLIQASNGKLYGMTSAGGANNEGVLFEYDAATNVLIKLFDFSTASGSNPYGSLLEAANGKLYGMTFEGGANSEGVLFEYDAGTNVYTKKFDFSSTIGTQPYGSLIQAVNGNLYGMTANGGSNYEGVLFEYDGATDVYTKKVDFSTAVNGGRPFGSLIQASNGKLFGLTSDGGANDAGVLFEYDAATDVYTKNFDFSIANGVGPTASLVQAANGKLYGLTGSGGVFGVGVLFEYDAATNVYTKKVDFSYANGAYPIGSLLEAANGKLYGMTSFGGANNSGVLFEYDAATNVLIKFFDFSTASGENPLGSLIQASNGKLYGMTYEGGANSVGVLFEYDLATDVYTKKIDFSSANGSNPYGSLIQASNGKLYGLTSDGGANDAGVLFEYDAATDVYTKKIDFSTVDGINPYGSMIKASNGKLYGMTYEGGASGQGVLFEYDPNSNVYVKKFDFSGSTGNRPLYGNLIEVNLSTTCIRSTIPTLATTNSSICAGSSTNLSISTGALNDATNWQWYSGSCGGTSVGSGTSITVTPAITTTYYARGEGGCVIPGACASITVTVNPLPTIPVITGNTAFCFGGSTTLSTAVVTGSLYCWRSNPSLTCIGTGNSIAVNSIGTYSVLLTDANGCSNASAVFAVNEAPVLTANCSGTPSSCTGNNGTASVSVSGGTAPYTYSWSNTVSGSVTLGASKDNTLYDRSGGRSNGVGEYMFAGRQNNNFITRAVMQFDFSAIPAGATITGVTLTLTCTASNDATGPQTMNLHRVSESWGEGTSNAGSPGGAGNIATTNDATWTARFYPSTLWSTVGGSFAGTVSGSTTVDEDGPYNWSSAGMIADVQAWVNNPASNFGWLLKGTEIGTNAKRYNTRENTAVSTRPTLNVTYILGSVSANQTGLPPGNYTVTVTDALGCTATCSQTISTAPVTVTVTSGANGSISPSTGTLACGSNAMYTITPNSCYSIADVVVDGVSVGAVSSYTFININVNHTISASFTQLTYSITASAGPNGTVTPAGTSTVNCGDNLSYNISPSACYSVADVLVDGVSVGAVSSYTFSNVQAPHTISATFVLNAPFPTPGPLSGPINVCPYIGTGTQLTYSVPAIAGATSYGWVIPPTCTLVSQNMNSIVITVGSGFIANANKQVRVTALSACGNSAQALFYLLAQLPNTPGTITASSTNVCAVLGTGSITYSIAPVVGATSYIWSAQPGVTLTPAGAGVLGNVVTATFPTTFTTSAITVRSVNDCGTSAARSITVTRNNPSTPSLINGPTMACPFISPNGTAATYSIPAVANATGYNWTVPAGVIGLTGQGTNSISFSYPPGFTSGVVSVTASNGCGTSAPRNLNINTLLPSTPGNIDVVNTGVCPNRTYTYTLATLPANAVSVNWTASAGTILSGNGTTNITVSYPASAINGVITAQAVNNCGQSVLRSISVKLPACVAAAPPPPFAKSANETNTLSDALSVNVYPNPTTTDFKLQVLTAGKEEISVRVLDMTGRFYKQLTVMPYQTINLGAELKAGAYMLEVKQGGVRKVVRVVKF